MKIILFLGALALSFWLARVMMVKAKQSEDEKKANAAVRFTQRLQQSEQQAQKAADAANRQIQQQAREANAAAEAGQ